ncbi:uncharacterized protein LOC126837450 [Adelges cooleyi]|uniref:uncharacterized protein LOC126837450 n=1 Tax=Adelges cooleyi TaxID=133065 RepID=UPI0021808F35|nr:uncharacterized protein LOC126837450 [Adelges cooleyi]
MKFQLRLISLALKIIFFISTEVSGDERQEMIGIAALRPTASEIAIAMSDSNIFRDVQVEHLQQFFYGGQYPVEFIQLLNEYKTLSSEPIHLSDEEITTLNSNYNDGSKTNRIHTQFKFCRKIQEIQCTNIVLFKFSLSEIESSLDDIAKYVYHMIEMSYIARFPVSEWLWKLYIHLQCYKTTPLEEYSPEINETLEKLIMLCQENKYLKEKSEDIFNYSNENSGQLLMINTHLNVYDDKFLRFVKGKEQFPSDAKDLLVESMWDFSASTFNPVSGLTFKGNIIYDIFKKEIENIRYQYNKYEWATEPFKHKKYLEIYLDALKVRFYGYIWIFLVSYQKIVESTKVKLNYTAEMRTSLQSEYESLLHDVNYILYFAYIDEQLFNEVLILLSEIYEPDDKKISHTVDKLAKEVNRILGTYIEPNIRHREAKIDTKYVERKCETDPEFLRNQLGMFRKFFRETEERQAKLKLNILSFYINVNRSVDFVFPNI